MASFRLFLLQYALVKFALVRSHGDHEQQDLLVRSLQDKLVRCSTPAMGETGIARLQRAVRRYHSKPTLADNDAVVVPVCFHSLFPEGGAPVNDEQLQAQLNHLNQAFAGSTSCCDDALSWCTSNCSVPGNIQFAMAELVDDELTGATVAAVNEPNACVTRTANSAWADGETYEATFKAALHRGGKETLHAYFAHMRGGLGYSRYPWSVGNLRLDGAVSHYRSLPGSGGAYGEGDTLVHEVGHWLGLPHTFDKGCSISDGIFDTPPESSPNFGCDPSELRDTCKHDDQLDPIHNFMDYSEDACMFRFTAGQMEMMEAVYDYFRLNQEDDDSVEITLTAGVDSEPLNILPGDQQLYSFSTYHCCTVQCTAQASEGSFVLYMNVDNTIQYNLNDDCVADASTGSDFSQICTVSLDNGARQLVSIKDTTVPSKWQFTSRLFSNTCGALLAFGDGDGGGDVPTSEPSDKFTASPSMPPTTESPFTQPATSSTIQPTTSLSMQPSSINYPSVEPSIEQSDRHSVSRSLEPSVSPTEPPSIGPSSGPEILRSAEPSSTPIAKIYVGLDSGATTGDSTGVQQVVVNCIEIEG